MKKEYYRPPLAMAPCGRMGNPESNDCVNGHDHCPFAENYNNDILIIR